MSYYYLEVTRGLDTGRRFLIGEGAISIGRSSENVICLNLGDRVVSSHHAILYKYPESITIQDMASTNGTYVNEQRITQQEIKVGDAIGFGEKGPRLTLVLSEQELSTTPQPARHGAGKTDPTRNSATLQTMPDSENKPDDELFSKKKLTPLIGDVSSMTMEMAHKLKANSMDVNDMHKLMHQGERIEKILQKGTLDEGQAHFLKTVYAAHRETRQRWFIIIGIIVGVSLMVTTFFAVRMFQYRNQVNKAIELEKQLDGYDKRIALAQSSGADTKEISTLVSEFEKTKGEFNSARMVLKEQDYGRFYADTVEIFISEIMSRFGETDYHIPPQMTERVKYHLGVYTGPLKSSITRYLQRKTVYFPLINRVFSEKKVPADLAYISMLESGFNPKALSSAGARGLWQFMPKTAVQFGLQVDDQIDERTDPQKTTYAAAEYFKDLIGIFGGKSSVMLAMAAYNAGEGRVMGALRKIEDPMRNRDFWYIYRMGYLAEETNEYIPRVLALMIIDTHQQHYGFAPPAPTNIEAIEAEDDFIPAQK